MFKTGFHFINGGKFISRGSGRHAVRIISTIELIYVLGGTLDMFEEDREYHLKKGDFLYLLPGRKHGGLTPYPPNLSFFWGHFTGNSKLLNSCPRTGHIHRTAAMGDYISMLLTEQTRDGDQLSSDLLLALLINETRRTAEDYSVPDTTLASVAEQAIKLHFTENISTCTIAAELKCNPDYLGRIFRRQFGCTLTEYLNRMRLRHAASLLASGYSSIKEAAYDSGFSDLSYFRRRFLQEYSMRPSEYRKQRLTAHINTQ